jgi:hypothetical protein
MPASQDLMAAPLEGAKARMADERPRPEAIPCFAVVAAFTARRF